MSNEALQTCYEDFNSEHFSGVLPEMPIMFAPLKGNGLFSCKVKTSTMPFSISMIDGTGFIKLAEELREDKWEGILIHEMIHAYFAVVGLATEGHGPNFEAKRSQIEEQSGIAVPI